MKSFSVFVVAVALLSAVRGETGEAVDDYSPQQHQEESEEYHSFDDYENSLEESSSDEVSTNLTFVDDYFREKFGHGVVEYFNISWSVFNMNEISYEAVPTQHAVFLNLTLDVIQYSETLYYNTMLEFSSSVANDTLQDVNATCGESLETRWREITNKTCVRNWFKKWINVKFEEAVKKFPVDCSLQICSKARCKFCTLAFREHFLKNSVDFFDDKNNWITSRPEFNTYALDVLLYESIAQCYEEVELSVDAFTEYCNYLYRILTSVPSIEPFKYDNLLRANIIKIDNFYIFPYDYKPSVKSKKQFTWGIIRSSEGKVIDPCLAYRDIYTWDSEEYNSISSMCYGVNMLQYHTDLLRCSSKDEIGAPLSWSTVPSAFFHSQCLCLASNGTGCRVKAPEGVEPLTYCLSVLLRDFQKQVSFRPALTYLDYSFKTRVPTCQFTNLLQKRFYNMCEDYVSFKGFEPFLSVQCSFYGLVNDTLNCSQIPMINSYNITYLCNLYMFVSLVHCDADVNSSVPFYSPGASTLVQVLTFLDVSVRTLTLVTYLSCPQLRNLPGKLLIGYQVTALLRLLVVRASVEDLAVAVRIDVASDLSSTLWLTSFLHFLTSSLRALRLPDSLSPQEVRVVLLRYCLLGWALPAALSTSFFFMDEAIHTHVQWGQLLFVLCYFVALLWNLYMFYFNCKFYYDVKTGAVSLRPGVETRTVFTGLLNFALKTSVLSGAGIIFRLLFAQFQGLEELLGYYHALGTLQGLLVFFFYGCNRESRDFWRRVLCQKLLPFLRPPQNRVV